MKKTVVIFIFLLFGMQEARASIIRINGKYSDDKYAPLFTLDEHFKLGYKLVQERRWEEANANFLVITSHFFDSPLFPDALFFSGVCYYYLKDFQMANKQISNYLKQKTHLKYFDKAFLFKYLIAEEFRKGAKKHLFDFEAFPKISPASDEALELYDEVISSLPHQELGAKALYGKSVLLKGQRKYKECVENLTTLLKRFPKTSFAADAYYCISEVYLEESERDTQNPDLLALAHVNLSHFKKEFPGDEKTAMAEENIAKMAEVFASSLYETGRFYERKKKLNASLIYYEEAMSKYPDTASAEKCKERARIIESKA